MNTMAEVLLDRETVEGDLARALLDGTWESYVAEHPELKEDAPADQGDKNE